MLLKNIKIIFVVLFILNLNNNNAYSIEPDVFVQSTVNRASQILSENISKEEKINKLKNIAKEMKVMINVFIIHQVIYFSLKDHVVCIFFLILCDFQVHAFCS